MVRACVRACAYTHVSCSLKLPLMNGLIVVAVILMSFVKILPLKSCSHSLGLLASFHLYNEGLIKLSAKEKKKKTKSSTSQ